MSFTENDRKLRSKNGKSFHNGGKYDGPTFADVIAQALKTDFGASPSAVKRVARLTHANERAVRNWFDSKNGPSGENLVSLMEHSDAIFAVVLASSRRRPADVDVALGDLRGHLVSAVATIDSLRERPV